MKIEPTGPAGVGPVEPTREPSVEGVGPARAPAPDRVLLSERAQEVQIAREALAALPVVRQQRVEHIRRLIADGAYEVDGATLAEDIIRQLRRA